MATISNVDQLRDLMRDEIKRKFADLVRGVKSGHGTLASVAAQIGVSRQALTQYADGSVPQSDVLLAAFLKWDWAVKIDNPGEGPAWFEFSISDMEGGTKRRKREPVQLSLFEALTEMDQNIETLKKSVGRVESEVERAFGKRA